VLERPQAQLAGVIGGAAASATWSGGTGTYNPSNTALNAIYTPSAAEIAAGGVTLTLTTNDPAGPCGATNDQVRININKAATANAGVDQIVCSSSPVVTLAGVIGGGAASGTWSGGAGTFNPDANTLNATYTPAPEEIAAGSVTLTLTSDDPNGPCGAVSDAMKITINPGRDRERGRGSDGVHQRAAGAARGRDRRRRRQRHVERRHRQLQPQRFHAERHLHPERG
jgi:hypothetical protein